ncbi:hypothetical protein FRB90_009980 [Tulasnella sp. 427]|nr:hypothetical protein FRB90_009980 [Tulasnella sp. 427]
MAVAKTAPHYGISPLMDVVERVRELQKGMAFTFEDTEVHSVLDDWATRVNKAARNQFSEEKYEPAYREYIANLEKLQKKAPAALAQLQTSLWENAW